MQSEIEQLLRSELSSGEKLLWSGQPRSGLRLRPTDIFFIPFSLMWCGFAIFWELSVMRTGAPFFFRLWGIPFVLVGLYAVVGRFFVDAWLRARTYYGLTNERVLVVSSAGQKQIQSLTLRQLPEITLTERPDQSGTIIFGAMPPGPRMPAGMLWPAAGRQLPLTFELIDNARQVYAQIQVAQRTLQPVGA